jgi:cytochrome c oxidase assembly factor CtaG
MLETLVQALPADVLAIAYFKRCATLARRGRPAPFARRLSFTGGLVLLLVSVLPPLSALDDRLLAWHMVQHLLMGDLAALLIVLGLTGPVLQPLLGLPVLGRLQSLSNPLVALPLWIVNLFVWHSPFLYQAALHSTLVHALQHGCFVGFGIVMWLALLGPLPKPSWFGNAARLGYVLGVRLAGALLANIFIWSGTVFYPDYRLGEAQHGVSALSDQGLAGSIMMLEGSIVTLALFAWLFLRAAAESERRQELLDLASAYGVALDERRAARAVAAGRAAELEKRLLERFETEGGGSSRSPPSRAGKR